MKYKSIEEIKRQMERYCAYQERSHYQVEQKLYEMGLYSGDVNEIVFHLIQEGFLNEERFARSYVRGKFYYKDWGKIKIINGLKQHRIHPNLIQKALTEIVPEDYEKTIQKLIEKKHQNLTAANDFTAKQKIARYLQQKGYRYDEFSGFLFDISK